MLSPLTMHAKPLPKHKAGEDLAKPGGPEKLLNMRRLSFLLSLVVDPAVAMWTSRIPTFRMVAQ